MIYILQDMSSYCANPALANILNIIKKILSLFQIIGPILSIVSLTIILIKKMSNPEEKKTKNAIRNWIICLIITLFLPVMINVLMSTLGVEFEVSACWNYADSAASNGTTSTYINPNPSAKPSSILPNSNDYSQGTKSDSSQSSNSSNQKTNIIFLGDSRTAQMRYYIVNDGNSTCQGSTGQDWMEKGNEVWSCKSSIGLDWLQNTGVPQIEAKITNGSAIVILMGVNDLYHPTSYINYINEKASTWKNNGASIYFVSVNPTDGSRSNLNSDIQTFNNKLKKGLSQNVTYIDTNSYLTSSGFTTADGLHYNKNTYIKIYNYIKKKL